MIIGVDCGKNKVHAVCSDGSAFSHEVKSGTPRDVSLQELRKTFLNFIGYQEVWTPKGKSLRLYVEAPVVAGARNIQSTIGIAETVGMVLSLGYPATLVAISTWKKVVVGKGNATKEEVAEWYERTGGSLRGQDFYDSSAICAYGVKDMEVAEHLRGGSLSAD